MDKQLLVLGIDPGTTTGYALLDLNGKLIHLASQKQLGTNELIRKVIPHGRVVIVGTDKKKVPSLIQNVTTKLGARIISPSADLKITEKKDMLTTTNHKISNDHEADALASALYALSRINPLIIKTEHHIKQHDLANHTSEIFEKVLLENSSINKATQSISLKEEPVLKQKPKSKIKKQTPTPQMQKLQEQIQVLKKDNALLKTYNKKITKQLKNQKRKVNNLKATPMDAIRSKLDSLLLNREKRIKDFDKELREKDKTIKLLKTEIKRLNTILIESNNLCILKKLNTLGSASYEARKMILNIQKDDILYVYNPNIISKSTVDDLREKISIIVHQKPVSRKMKESLPFIFVQAKSLHIEDLGIIAITSRQEIISLKKKQSTMHNLVLNYQKSRVSLR